MSVAGKRRGKRRLGLEECSLKVERARNVQHCLEPIDLDRFVKSSLLGNVLHDPEVELVLAGFGMSLTELVRLIF